MLKETGPLNVAPEKFVFCPDFEISTLSSEVAVFATCVCMFCCKIDCVCNVSILAFFPFGMLSCLCNLVQLYQINYLLLILGLVMCRLHLLSKLTKFFASSAIQVDEVLR